MSRGQLKVSIEFIKCLPFILQVGHFWFAKGAVIIYRWGVWWKSAPSQGVPIHIICMASSLPPQFAGTERMCFSFYIDICPSTSI